MVIFEETQKNYINDKLCKSRFNKADKCWYMFVRKIQYIFCSVCVLLL